MVGVMPRVSEEYRRKQEARIIAAAESLLRP
jgi:hypothetical protein